MPSRLSKLFAPSDKEKEALAQAERRPESTTSHSPPPGYDQTEGTRGVDGYDRDNAIEVPDITAGFSNLSISKSKDGLPVTGEVIAHLKLLECFYRLKQSIGSHDGLFGISNAIVTDHAPGDSEEAVQLLAKLAEKRWAVYVQRAVYRYESWLWMLNPNAKMPSRTWLAAVSKNGNVVENVSKPLLVSKRNLPPVDVLMVWHAHMLNPRAYLEDCIRQGREDLWPGGMPWSDVAESIDSQTFTYNAGTEARNKWESCLDSTWESAIEATPRRIVKCHHCSADNTVQYTTCSDVTLSANLTSPHELTRAIDQLLTGGLGFADRDFQHRCHSCAHQISHDSLQAGKLCKDIDLLLKHNKPLGGTVLSLSGVPSSAFGRHDELLDAPNQLFRNRLGAYILSDPSGRPDDLTHVRLRFEEALRDRKVMRAARGGASGVLLRKERIAVRKMMSRYWNNSSPFALDLVGAVVRQGSFVEKMHNIDWIHSPALKGTLRRLLQKYIVFVRIMANHPTHMAVPTLDVDLAWHTHQLTPRSYMKYTIEKAKQFIDHDDKVTEIKLNDSFAWTSKIYQKWTGMPYSECTCWYCEAIRESHTSAASRLLGTSSARIADQTHSLVAAEAQDPKKSVHISAHNAVRPEDEGGEHQRICEEKSHALEKQYRKACERAVRKGRKAPRRDDYYYSDAYGYPVYIPAYSPYVGSVPYMPMYYPVTPGCMAVGAGAVGNCCSGTCGGGGAVAGCGSAASGGCGGGGGSSGGAGCGGGGGGGGGCGGGGGGGGGGCGGGGGGC